MSGFPLAKCFIPRSQQLILYANVVTLIARKRCSENISNVFLRFYISFHCRPFAYVLQLRHSRSRTHTHTHTRMVSMVAFTLRQLFSLCAECQPNRSALEFVFSWLSVDRAIGKFRWPIDFPCFVSRHLIFIWVFRERWVIWENNGMALFAFKTFALFLMSVRTTAMVVSVMDGVFGGLALACVLVE